MLMFVKLVACRLLPVPPLASGLIFIRLLERIGGELL